MRAVALRCPYCLSGFDPNDAITRCSQCHAIHHTVCWTANHHCSVFACDGRGCESRSFPRSMELLSPILLFLLFLFPHQMIFFVPLLVPAQLCSLLITLCLIGEIFHGCHKEWDVLTKCDRGLSFASNLIAIFLGPFTLMGLMGR